MSNKLSIIQKCISVAFLVVLCLMLIASILDTQERNYKTNFNQENIITHIEKLSENGPHSIADKVENIKAMEYIISQVESLGAVNENTTDKFAYQVQEFVATDTDYQNWYLDNVIVHIPANSENKSGEAVMLMAHYDSVPMGQGSSDDAVAISVMLEAINYYTNKMSQGYTITNDLVFCFVNGEEYGLYGSNAFMNEFNGFDNIVNRIKFGINLESRGTSGTLIMFETSKNNYNTVKLFSQVNKSLFTCSIATMVYDMMPNGTDFSNFKEYYQGINMANVGSGEDYHTQNDNPGNVGKSYMSQQAQIVDGLISKLSSYNLSDLYNADESAIFFSYLNITTVVYNHTVTYILAIIGILLLIANILLSIFYRKENNIKNTAKAIGACVVAFILSAAVTYACYFIFQLISALFGVIDIHTIGTITYSNIAIVVGIGILSLGISVITIHFARKLFKIDSKHIRKAFAYVHIFVGIVLSFVLPDASYLFTISGILLMINEILITSIKKIDMEKFHFEILAIALYLPIVIPVIFLATTALGLTMAYVYGLLFALTVFGLANLIVDIADKINKSIFTGVSVMTVALIIFLVVSLIKPNPYVNLQGKQGLSKLPYDDALVYVHDQENNAEYRIYDLNAYSALKNYSPKMKYENGYYVCETEKKKINHSILSTADANTLNIVKTDESSLVYLYITPNEDATIIVDDGITQSTHNLLKNEKFTLIIHSNCTLTLNNAQASIEYREVIIDYENLIPQGYMSGNEKLHFNLWLTKSYTLG